MAMVSVWMCVSICAGDCTVRCVGGWESGVMQFRDVIATGN